MEHLSNSCSDALAPRSSNASKTSTKREIKAAINSIGPLAKGALSLVRKTCGKRRNRRRSDALAPECPNACGEDALMVREVLQSVIGSLRLRCVDPVARLTEALDAYVLDKTFKIEDFLFPPPKA